MNELRLYLPTPEDEVQVMAYRQEFFDRGDSLDGTGTLRNAESYDRWLADAVANRSPETVQPGLVDATTFLGKRVSDGRLVGFVDVRHRLNDHLLAVGGHIGYSVRPDERQKGYATELLRLGLCFCRDTLGLARVLVTCDTINIASAKAICRNGGMLENEVEYEGEPLQRHWIAL